MIVGLTNARFLRDRGAVAYGASLLSPTISGGDFSSRFHGNDERVDLESIDLTTRFYAHVIDTMVS